MELGSLNLEPPRTGARANLSSYHAMSRGDIKKGKGEEGKRGKGKQCVVRGAGCGEKPSDTETRGHGEKADTSTERLGDLAKKNGWKLC